MLFNSVQFFFFFAVVLALYTRLGHRGQNRLLLVASYVFYGAWNWRFLGLIGFTTVADFFIARAIAASETERRRRLFVALALAVHLTILGTFKYYDFFALNLQQLLAAMGLHVQMHFLRVVLPVGVSFYTFQAISYTMDVYRRQVEPARDFLDYALFVAFFPQLVAGPIERATHMLPQITKPRRLSWAQFCEGSHLVLWGLFKKVYVADNLANLVDPVFGASHGQWHGAEVLLAVYAFAIQIYCDFSGYTDMARGLARCLGFELKLNFNLPYFARSPTEFWRRWHISLSTWLRDYLYIPLGGNRHGTWRTHINLIITMLLGGLWHGAAGTFVAWGAYHGVLLVLHKLAVTHVRVPVPAAGYPRPVALAIDALKVFVCFHLICVSWLLFRADSLSQVHAMLGALRHTFGFSAADGGMLVRLAAYSLPLLVIECLQARRGDLLATYTLPLLPRTIFYMVLLNLILIFGVSGTHAFIYFQF